MFDTFALIISDIWQGLGEPEDAWLTLADVARAAIHSLALYGLASQQSANARNNRSITIYPNERDVPLDDMQGVMLPSYLERKIGTEPNEVYVYCAAVRLSEIEEARLRGDDRCCIYKDELGKWRLRTSYDPTNVAHRVWYYSDPVFVGTVDAAITLPTRFGPMFVARGIIRAATIQKMKMAKLPTEVRPDLVVFEALDEIVAENKYELERKDGWEQRYKYEMNATRSPRPQMRRSILAHGRRR